MMSDRSMTECARCVRLRAADLPAVFVALLSVTVTPGADAQTPAGGGRRGAPACRAYASAYVITTAMTGSRTSTTAGTCRFEASTNKTTCTNQYSDSAGAKNTSVSVTTFESPADAIDEVQVVPPLKRAITTTTNTTGSSGSFNATLTYTHDDRKRLTREVVTSSGATTTTTTYTAWDPSGRPTLGDATFASGVRNTLKITYNNAARTQTTVTTSRGQQFSNTFTFDADGNVVSAAAAGQAGSTKAVTRVTATERICR
jgi:hypothetical protein